jgi:hypothetical protein
MNELRCEGTMHGKLLDENHLEVKCGRRACGARPGVVVLHTFDLTTSEYVTRRFADPRNSKKGNVHDATKPVTAVRAS